ncbi:hypothetical protein [Streptomyces sp. RKAG293]|uniref:hypothetical protein n=1 Tax=Streptomyces sp. RKAG293 TaxID=2893403 RepID=UPI0020331E35|nr:hypothetical protein [Streptomyces sp. RKAG293]MCM2416698.1 hypothetical protein [Streptomyces sp. RKAG293]
MIARTLLDRLQTHKSPSRDADLRRVLRLAEAARADRRRWDGPSDAAAAVLLQARLLLPDTDAALAAALPAPQGEATATEAAAPGLAAFAARIAYRDGRTDTADALAARSASASDRYAAELAAARAAAIGASEDEQRRLWGEALEAAGDDEQRLTACKRLAELGQWPIPVLEGLRAADSVARDLYAVMEAKARHHGDPAGALRLLRPLQNTSVYAVIAMAELLEADGHPEQAAQVLQQGGTRFADVHLDLAALDVLRRGGDQQGAETQAFRILAPTPSSGTPPAGLAYRPSAPLPSSAS